MKYIEINDGVAMPQMSFGTYQIAPSRTEHCVTEALRAGYRGVDTAQNYGNEREVGAAVRKSGLNRDQVFVTTKTQTSGYTQTVQGINRSLEELGMDYVDLLLIHWPMGDVVETYRALEEAYRSGKARAIGISNFYGRDLDMILDECEIVPAVNQIECHVFWQQDRMRPLLKQHGIHLMDWSPLASGEKNVFTNPTLTAIGQQYGKTAAQVALCFLLQHGDLMAVKSTHYDRMVQNLEACDFALTDDDMKRIDALDEGRSISGWPSSGRIAEY